jgi:NAD(P)H-hydrate epimerase
MVPSLRLDTVPPLTAEQMREVDRLMVEEVGIDLARTMENVGANLASLAIDLFAPRTACVLAGAAGNGGGGMTAARHLSNRGVAVTVVPSRGKDAFDPVPAQQLDILRWMNVPIVAEPRDADLVIDALIGYSLRGAPRGRAAELIRWANDASTPVLSLDVPSGLDATTGETSEPCIHAAVTMALALPKTGLLVAREQVGRLYVADISVPPTMYRRFGITVPPLFETNTIVELTG